MDDILAKKNRHLFLEEKDNQNNSFIGNINDVANRKEELDIVAAHIENIGTVEDHINNIDTVANNISDINDAVDNIATVKTFNDNVNNGTMQYLLEAFTTSLDGQGNAWEVRLTQLGESILATTSAFNYSTVVTVSSDIPVNGTLILPNSMKYKVGTHMLMVSWNGTVCYAGEQYDEVGAYGVWATSIKLNQPAKTGDKIQFRVVALADAAAFVGQIDSVIGNTSVVATGSTENRTLANRFADIVNVKDYGAKGDGTTDDTAAFEAAAVVGDTIFVPEGTYYLPTEPVWPSGKSIVLFTVSKGASFTGTYGLLNIGTLGRGLTFRQVNSDPQNGRHILNLYQKITDTGDASNGVFSSVYSTTSVAEGNKKKVWGITGAIRTYATNSSAEAVGGYFQGWRQQDDSYTPTWGSVSEVRDNTADGSPGGLVGIEVDCVSNGSCENTAWNRVGIDITGGSTNKTSTYLDENEEPQLNRLGFGVRVGGWRDINDSSKRQAVWHAGLELSGAFDFGCHAASYSYFYGPVYDASLANFDAGVDKVGLQLAKGQYIAFSANHNDAMVCSEITTGNLSVRIGKKECFSVSSNYAGCRGVSIRKYAVDGNGNETLIGTTACDGVLNVGSATASFSASNKPGSTNLSAPSTWLHFILDGATYWCPLFKD